MSAVPIIGIAPIMVMWFGFGWQSKAAVVAVVTFFPMLVNALAGLAASEPLQLDLMRSYAAGYGQTLLTLRLPDALPFVFNALKLNSTLALIGAIVAEFFGTPIVGMGFRISTEVARMNLDVVWATIAVAALAGSACVRRPGTRRARRHRLASVRTGGADRDTTDNVEREIGNAARLGIAAAAVAAFGVVAATAASAADKVTLQLKWVTQGQFAGYYVAAGQGLLQGRRPRRHDQAGRPRHRPGAGDRRRRSRRHRRLDAGSAGRAREGRAARQHRPDLQEVGHDADLPQGHRHHEAGRLQGQDARRLVRRQRVSVPDLDGQAGLQTRRRPSRTSTC